MYVCVFQYFTVGHKAELIIFWVRLRNLWNVYLI